MEKTQSQDAGMDYGLFLSAQAATANRARTENIANNLANANTPGFRKDFMVFKERPPESLEQSIKWLHINPLMDKLGGGVQVADTYTDFSNQDIVVEETGSDFDVHLEGDGFFKIKDSDGELLYTRAGNFTRDAQGFLAVAGSGVRVLDSEGEEIALPFEEFVVDPSGVIESQGRRVAKIAAVTFDDRQDLMKIGRNLFRYMGPGQEQPAAVVFRQGYLEGSSVNTVAEMTAMIEGHRAYEANMNMMRVTDQTLEALVNRVGKTS